MQNYSRNRIKIAVVFMIILLLTCSSFIYNTSFPSAREQFAIIAKVPPHQLPLQREALQTFLQQSLLQQLPLGTKVETVYSYLEDQNIPRKITNDITDEDLIYSISTSERNSVYMIIKEDLGKMTFPCRAIFVTEFSFDDERALNNIAVKDESACL